jgi:hypothetical protein
MSTFGDAIARSMAAAPPGTTLADWAEATPEGRLLAAAQALGDATLLAWLLAAPMKEAAPAPHPGLDGWPAAQAA